MDLFWQVSQCFTGIHVECILFEPWIKKDVADNAVHILLRCICWKLIRKCSSCHQANKSVAK